MTIYICISLQILNWEKAHIEIYIYIEMMSSSFLNCLTVSSDYPDGNTLLKDNANCDNAKTYKTMQSNYQHVLAGCQTFP